MKSICQSCGMPMKKDKDFGTEADGSLSSLYCSHCYVQGQFTQDFKNVKEMKEFIVNTLVKKKFPKLLAKIFVMNIQKLKRWS